MTLNASERLVGAEKQINIEEETGMLKGNNPWSTTGSKRKSGVSMKTDANRTVDVESWNGGICHNRKMKTVDAKGFWSDRTMSKITEDSGI